MGGGAGVLARLTRRERLHPLGQPRREALVVHLHRDCPPRRRASCAANARVSRVCAVSPPLERQRQPDDHALDLALATSSRSAREAARVAGRRTGSIGVTIVPVGSLSAQPQRALP